MLIIKVDEQFLQYISFAPSLTFVLFDAIKKFVHIYIYIIKKIDDKSCPLESKTQHLHIPYFGILTV